jgi:hypothetical protein
MRRYWKHVLRLACFGLVCFAALVYIDYRVARATVREGLLSFGRRMAPYVDDGSSTETPRTFRFNGIDMHLAVGHTSHPPKFVRDWYLNKYAPQGKEMEAFRDELQRKGMLGPHIPHANQITTGDDNNGTIAAIDFGGPITKSGILDRLKQVMSEQDLGKVGQLRYVMYYKVRTGTRFVTIWTEPEVKLSKLVAMGDQDAEGSDLPGVPRYPGTKRIVSAAEVGNPQAMAVYEGPGTPENVLSFYRARMRGLGWAEDTLFHDKMSEQGNSSSARFQKQNGNEVVIDVSPEGRGVMVTAIQMH